MKIVQCWDDGVEDDIRLCEILREHGAKASFNLNPGLHGSTRSEPWRHKGIKDVRRLALSELPATYDGFTIANHSLSHPWATRIPAREWKHEVDEGRRRLQDIFQQPVDGFAYPYGDSNAEACKIVREAGHAYARTCQNVTPCFPPQDPMQFSPDSHHAAADFWERYEKAKSLGAPVFYFWGHSYEFITESDWFAFSEKLVRLNADPDACWADLPELFKQS